MAAIATKTSNGVTALEPQTSLDRESEEIQTASLSTACGNFRKTGLQFENLLKEGLRRIATTATQTGKSQEKSTEIVHNKDDAKPGNPKENSTTLSHHVLLKMVREKQTECNLLQQKVESFQSEVTQLEAIVESLREAKKQQEGNETRLRLALRRAGKNATLARNQANEAEANANALAKKVEFFETVVQEIKRTSALLLKEQGDIGAGVEGMERDYVEAQADLVRSNNAKATLQAEQRRLNKKLEEMKARISEVQEELEGEQNGRMLLKRKFKELEERVQMEQSRSNKLQTELDSAQSLLVDSTSTTSDSKDALDNCKQALERMEEANKNLHDQIQEHQSSIHKLKISHQEELNRVRKAHRTTQVELNNQKELFQRLKLEKLAANKRQASQATKILALERRLKESTDLMTTTTFPPRPSDSNSIQRSKEDGGQNPPNRPSLFQPSNRRNDVSFTIPPLGDMHIPQRRSPMKNKCSICLKASSGLMRKCECGRKDCVARAHASCAQRACISTLTPGKTIPTRKPVILCGSLPATDTPSSKSTDTMDNSFQSGTATITPFK